MSNWKTKVKVASAIVWRHTSALVAVVLIIAAISTATISPTMPAGMYWLTMTMNASS